MNISFALSVKGLKPAFRIAACLLFGADKPNRFDHFYSERFEWMGRHVSSLIDNVRMLLV